MKNICLPLLFLIFAMQSSCQHSPTANQKPPNTQPSQQDRPVGGPCECCNAWQEGLPEKLHWETVITPPGEPGEPLEISGTIFKKDGKTPAEGIILYIYHTDREGNYSRGSGSDCTRRHGLLRGWMKTGPDGRYQFRTIRPASYPGTTIEQHIHPVIKEPGYSEYWIDEFVFDDDPNLSESTRNNRKNRGSYGVLKLIKGNDGIWRGQRDITLGKNVPGYE